MSSCYASISTTSFHNYPYVRGKWKKLPPIFARLKLSTYHVKISSLRFQNKVPKRYHDWLSPQSRWWQMAMHILDNLMKGEQSIGHENQANNCQRISRAQFCLALQTSASFGWIIWNRHLMAVEASMASSKWVWIDPGRSYSWFCDNCNDNDRGVIILVYLSKRRCSSSWDPLSLDFAKHSSSIIFFFIKETIHKSDLITQLQSFNPVCICL